MKLPGGFASFASLAVLSLGLSSVTVAHAGILYDFSLPANGQVGAFDIQLVLPDFAIPEGLQVYTLDDPAVRSFTYAGELLPAFSSIGFEVTPTFTVIGLELVDCTAVVMLNQEYPFDFFIFSRLPYDTGSSQSLSSRVLSSYDLDTASPVGTLSVITPEPAPFLLLGLALPLLAFAHRRSRRSPAA